MHPSIHPSRPVIGIAWSDGPGKHWRADRHRALYRKYRVKMMRQPWDFKGFQGILRASKEFQFWHLEESWNWKRLRSGGSSHPRNGSPLDGLQFGMNLIHSAVIYGGGPQRRPCDTGNPSESYKNKAFFTFFT